MDFETDFRDAAGMHNGLQYNMKSQYTNASVRKGRWLLRPHVREKLSYALLVDAAKLFELFERGERVGIKRHGFEPLADLGRLVESHAEQRTAEAVADINEGGFIARFHSGFDGFDLLRAFFAE